MFWFDRHHRFRDQLSAYVDGELDSPAAQRLESHLAECGRCRTELEQLRATVVALRELPEAEVPRSFALSPEQVSARRPAAPTPVVGFGMRMAAAGVAVALAAVLVADLGEFGGDGAIEEAAAPQTPTERGADEVEMGPATGAVDLGAPGDAMGLTPAAPGEEEGEAKFMGGARGAEETPAAGGEAPEMMPDQDTAEAPSGGGIDALTAAEIGLAAALGILVAGSLALALAGRKR